MFLPTLRKPSALFSNNEKGMIINLQDIITDEDKYGLHPGTTSNYFSTPSSTANQITGDIDLRWCGTLASVTPAAYYFLLNKSGGLGTYSYWISVASTTGDMLFSYSTTGSDTLHNISTVSIPSAGIVANTKVWLRATRSSSTGDINFYYSSNGVNWTQLGTTVTSAPSAIYASSSSVDIGLQGSTNLYPLSGKTYRAQIYNGINGTLAVDFNPSDYTAGTVFTSRNTKEVWTVSGSCKIYPTKVTAYQECGGRTPALLENPIGLLTDTIDRSVARTKYAKYYQTTGSYFSTPDSAGNSVTGDITIHWVGTLDNISPVTSDNMILDKWTDGTATSSYVLAVMSPQFGSQFQGKVEFGIRNTAGTSSFAISTATLASVGLQSNQKFGLYAQREAATGIVKVFYSSDLTNYSQLGTDLSTTSGNITDSTSVVGVGGRASGGGTYLLLGKTYRLKIISGLGLGGTVTMDFNPADYVTGASTFTSSTTSEVYTLNGDACILPEGGSLYQTTSTKRPVLSALYNQLTYSEQFSDASWTKLYLTQSIVQVTPPYPTMVVTKLTEGAVNSVHICYKSVVATANLYVFSVYMKAAERTWGILRLDMGGNQLVSFNLSNGIIGTVTNGYNAFIKSVGNGWYKCSVVRLLAAATWYPVIAPGSADNTQSYAGDGTSGIYVTGADLRLFNDSATTVDIVNMLTYPSNFENAVWSKLNTSIAPDAIIAPNNALSADILLADTSGNNREVGQTFTSVSGYTYTFIIYVKAKTSSWCYLTISDRSAQADGWYFDVTNGVVGGSTGLKIGTAVSKVSASAEPSSHGFYKCILSCSISTAATFYANCGVVDANNAISVTAGNDIYIWGALLYNTMSGSRFSIIPDYQRVNSALDYEFRGFPKYLAFDGATSGKYLLSEYIDFSSTDKVTVFAGIRKTSANSGTICELSPSVVLNNGTFWLVSEHTFSNAYTFGIKGTQFAALGNNTQSYLFPSTNTISCKYDISQSVDSAEILPRVNNIVPTLSRGVSGTSNDAGTGNFGNYQTYIGITGNGLTAPFTGRIYSLVIVGKLCTDAEIANTEYWINQQTKAY